MHRRVWKYDEVYPVDSFVPCDRKFRENPRTGSSYTALYLRTLIKTKYHTK